MDKYFRSGSTSLDSSTTCFLNSYQRLTDNLYSNPELFADSTSLVHVHVNRELI